MENAKTILKLYSLNEDDFSGVAYIHEQAPLNFKNLFKLGSANLNEYIKLSKWKIILKNKLKNINYYITLDRKGDLLTLNCSADDDLKITSLNKLRALTLAKENIKNIYNEKNLQLLKSNRVTKKIEPTGHLSSK